MILAAFWSPAFWSVVATLFLASSLEAADSKGATYDSPQAAKADADFAVQGEYTGELTRDGEKRKVAIQVIALGHGKFHAVFYPGGLPGDGWDKQDKHEADGETKDGVTRFKGEHGSGEIKNGVLSLISGEGEKVGELKRVERKSPTLGKQPPTGAIVLFDGKNADEFENGRVTADGLLQQGVVSKRKFGSFTLHVEFRTPFMPEARDQGRGNSGCYIQGRYELQVLDSFGLAGKNNECGGIYTLHDPAVNMCFPPLSWQTYDIDFTSAQYDAAGKKTKNARVTIKHNGVTVHDDFELPTESPGGIGEGPGKGPIMLQDHGNPVRFKNIWIVEK
jgi:hypothetical protein